MNGYLEFGLTIMGVIIIFYYILKNPYKYSHYVINIDVSGQRNVSICDEIEKYIICHGLDEFSKIDETMKLWKKSCYLKAHTSILRPLRVKLCTKANWALDENGKVLTASLLNRETECHTISVLCSAELNPSDNKDTIVKILEYFSSECSQSMSPQSLYRTDNCNYETLIKDYTADRADNFDQCLQKILELIEPGLWDFQEDIPNGATVSDLISNIEVSYPETWDISWEI